jgi:PAS domain S-box-containing protein
MANKARALPEAVFLRRLRTWLALGNAVIVAVLLALVAQWQAGILHSEREDERSRVQGLALSVSQTIAGQMDQVDLGLKSVTQQIQALERQATAPRGAQVNALLADQLRVMPFLEGLMVTDASGTVRYADHPDPDQSINLGARAHFRQARAQPRPAMVISEAVVSLANRGQMIFAVRRLEHADGSFAGVVSAAISPAHFQKVFGALELGDKGSVSLRNDARQILARTAGGQSQDRWFGSTEASPELARAFDSKAASGSFVSTVRQDGIERISAFRRVGDYPFMVIVGEDTNRFLLPWRAQVERIAMLCTLAVAIMAAFSVVLYASIWRATAGRTALERALQRSQAWQQASADSVHIVDANGTIVSASASLADMLGYRPDYLAGHSLSLLTALPLPELLAVDTGTAGAVRKLQTQYRRHDGSLLDVEVYVSTLALGTEPLFYCSARDITHFLSA